MKVIFTLFFGILFLLSCKPDKSSMKVHNQPEVEEIVIIFNQAPKKKSILTPMGIGQTVFFEKMGFYFDSFEEKNLNPKRKTTDTIIIRPKNSVIELNIEDGKYDFLRYILQKGDTLILDYQENIPNAYLKNANKFESNYDIFVQKKLGKEFSEKIRFLYPLPFVEFKDGDTPATYTKRFNRFKSETGINMLNDLITENEILDSLNEVKKISFSNYQFRKSNIALYKLHYLSDQEKIETKTIDSLLQKADKLLFNRLFRDLLQKIIQYKYIGQYSKAQKKKFSIDSRDLFDSISTNPNIPVSAKTYLLYNNLGQIAKNFSTEDFKLYYDKFKEKVKDTLLINYINEKYLVDFSSSNRNDGILFSTIEKEKVLLNDILIENRGKLIYVDFWASWCAPCRAAMPRSKVLREKFSDKGVVFLYISIDKDWHEWMNATKKEGLLNYKNNMIALNYPEADLYRNIKLSAIPRYLIYDKNGVLSYKNAPAPNSKQIDELIEKLLMED